MRSEHTEPIVAPPRMSAKEFEAVLKEEEAFTFDVARPTGNNLELAIWFAENGASRSFVRTIGGEKALDYMPKMSKLQRLKAFLLL